MSKKLSIWVSLNDTYVTRVIDEIIKEKQDYFEKAAAECSYVVLSDSVKTVDNESRNQFMWCILISEEYPEKYRLSANVFVLSREELSAGKDLDKLLDVFWRQINRKR